MNNVLYCPYCNGSSLRKKGSDGGKKRYKCNDCGRKTVRPLTAKSDNIQESPKAVPSAMETIELDKNSAKIVQRYQELKIDIPHPDFHNPKVIIERERQISKLNRELHQLGSKYKYLTSELEVERRKNEFYEIVGSHSPSRQIVRVEPTTGKNDNEAAAVICLSDLHLEEDVNPITINNLNEYNPKIAETRFKNVFFNALKLIRQQQADIKIANIILWLGGDIISNYIHEELMETNHLSPNKAILFADELITWGIDFLLNNTKCAIIVPTSYGNHGRSTEFSRIQTGADNSWEYLLYKNLERRYAKEKRVRFQVAEGYHNYVDIFDFKIRFHHGDAMRYGGGVGGITIPVNKAIADWDRSIRADLDVFGHFHQLIFSTKFICNGSLIGYNAFALSIKASPEDAQQAFFLVDKLRNKVTMRAPIFVD